MAADGAAVRLEKLEYVLQRMHVNIDSFPLEAQYDIETFARSFRNQLAAGPAAHLALMLVSAELSIEFAKKMAAEKPR